MSQKFHMLIDLETRDQPPEATFVWARAADPKD
jgi:hypothetical protein